MHLRFIYLLAFLCYLTTMVYAQPPIGVEVFHSTVETFNTRHLEESPGYGPSWFEEDERSIVTSAYGVNFYYKISERHLLKGSVAHHRNGRLIDVTWYDDTFIGTSHAPDLDDFRSVYEYTQLGLGYVHRIPIGRFLVPLEAALLWNHNHPVAGISLGYTKRNNHDIGFSAGIQYKITPHLLAGVSGIYQRGLSDYLQENSHSYEFIPRQIGVRFALGVEFAERSMMQ